MHSNQNFDLHEQLEDLNDIPAIRNVSPKQLRRRKKPKPAFRADHTIDETTLAEQRNELSFTYQASKHEKVWLENSLTDFYDQQWFDDILCLIKGGGKEASVYQCLGNQTTQADYLAAKVYRPRKFRQLRNDSLYREGRIQLDDEGHEIHDGRALHAIQKRTGFGMKLMHTSWIEHEFQTMKKLYEVGVDIPEPYVSGNNAILMAYIGWDDTPAPTLNTIKLSPKELQKVFEQAIHNVELMLANQRVHGDLSAYNILYFEGEIYLIDFPQAINPNVNRNAYPIFQRDITRLCDYFQAQGLKLNPGKLAQELWQKYADVITANVDPPWWEPEIIE